eukprot:Skav201262  [mRNA]  locus=scaffold1129:60542:63013:- [translate_table: standard]
MLCDWGPAVGDDEMSWFMRRVNTQTDRHAFGVYRWTPEHSWTHCKEWDATCKVTSQKEGLAMWCINQHWVAIQIKWSTDPVVATLEYVCDIEFREEIIQAWIATYMPDIEVRTMCIHAPSSQGWCGFTAMQWMFVDCFSHFPLPTEDTIQQIDAKMREVVGPTKHDQYALKMNQTPVSMNMNWVSCIRGLFIQDQMTDATSPIYYGLGLEDQPGTTAIRAMGKLAAVLIGKGVSSEESIRIAKSITDTSVSQAKHIVQQKDAKAYILICEFCAKHEIQFDAIHSNQAAKKLQQIFRAKYRQTTNRNGRGVLDLSKVTFDPRSFMLQNGEFQAVMPTWTPASKGISIATIKDVQKYLEKGEHLSTESNTALIAEEVQENGQVKVERISVQVTDQKQNRAIVSATLIHFGPRPIVKVPPQNAEVDTQDTTTMAIQVHKHLLDSETWTSMYNGPVKVVLKAIQSNREEQPILNVWSRRWSSGTSQVDCKLANEFSFLVLIPADQTNEWLQKSGTLSFPCFLSIRRGVQSSSEVEPHRIIWLSKSLGDTQAQLGKLESHAGVVFKKPTSFGVRVAASSFEDCWQLLKGDASVPSLVKPDYKYSVDGLPSGLSNVQIEAWGDAIKWPIRVLRRISDNKVLVGSETVKPAKEVSLNSQPLLILEHKDQSKPSSSILVGRLDTETKAIEGWTQATDPWNGAKLGQKRTIEDNSVSPWSGYKPTTLSAPPGLSRTTSSSASNARLDAVEQELEQLKSTMQSHQQETRDQFVRVAKEIAAVSGDLKLSLAEALREQSQSLVQQFGELLKKSPRTPTGVDPSGERGRSRSHGK